MAQAVKGAQLYEGKAKKVFATDNPDLVIVDYKDDATAGDGAKKGTIKGKGVINNQMTNIMFAMLEKHGVPTHLVEELSERETLVKKVEIVPLEVIVRNVAAGSFSKRMGVEEGRELLTPILEFSYKNDELHDPFINDYYALALGLATKDELDTIDMYKTDFENTVAEYEGRWLKDGGPTDEEWEAYKATLEDSCGIEELKEVYQAAYDRYKEASAE